jgi:hypothetical protein
VFGALVIALLGYVYWSTTTFVLSRSDSVIVVRSATLLSRMLVHRSGQTAVMALARRIPLVMGNIAQHTRIAKRRLIGGTFRNEFSDVAREIQS